MEDVIAREIQKFKKAQPENVPCTLETDKGYLITTDNQTEMFEIHAILKASQSFQKQGKTELAKRAYNRLSIMARWLLRGNLCLDEPGSVVRVFNDTQLARQKHYVIKPDGQVHRFSSPIKPKFWFSD